MDLQALEAEALKLPFEDRSRLVERLVASFDADPEVERAWEQVADERESALAEGRAAVVAGREAVARLRDALR